MIKKNIVANYIGEAYVALIGTLMLPVYIAYMGKEAYGLVGFYVLLQSWLRIFDMGLTPTIGREAARYNGDKKHPARLMKLLHLFVGIFFLLAIVFVFLSVEFSYKIATEWLTVEKLSYVEVSNCVELMALVVALRWVSSLYRGVVTGYEKFVWLSKYQMLVATSRFVLVIPVLMFLYDSPVDFFRYQLAVVVLEIVVLISYAYHLLPKINRSETEKIRVSGFSREFQFSGVIAFTGIVSVIITQSDKLIMSSLLTLTQYAIFNVAVIVASAVLLVNRPIINVLRATITRLYAEEKKTTALSLYRKSTQLVAIGGTTISAFFFYSGYELLMIWTGDTEIAHNANKILWLYGLGNAVVAIAGMQILLQYAEGILKYHFWGNFVFALTIVPMLYFLATTYGAIGAAIAWLSSSLLILLLWTPIVHKRFAPGLHMSWLANDVLIIFVTGFGVGYVVNWLLQPQEISFVSSISFFVLQIIVVAFGCMLASSYARTYVIQYASSWCKGSLC